ncbi:XdhC family protein [Streptomyces inhibens]|uniref:XdhC family protein n=1 Tax=Streptomyces inhibens TaxID=2293571 RepID=UPI001EE6E381|nr:XdhC family protein [Streptomyces inhibens]UKY53056.1 hypothetical protein KI385_32495 [Streptomyces inhibens]
MQAVEGETARVLAAAHRAVTAERPVVVARVTSGPDGRAGRTIALLEDRHLGSTGRVDLDAAVLAHARTMLGTDDATVRAYDPGDLTEPQETAVSIAAELIALRRPQRAGTLGNLPTTLAHTVHQA